MIVFIRVFLLLLGVDIVLSLLLRKNELDADGYLEIGFPFRVYRTTDAKMDAGAIREQFFAGNLLLNLLIVAGLTFIIFVFIRLTRSMRQTK